MAGKNLQRGKTKANQSTITHFFSKQTAKNGGNCVKEEAQIKSIYFSPEKKQNSTSPLKYFSKRSLRLKKFPDPTVISELKSAESNSTTKTEEIDEKEENLKVLAKSLDSCYSNENDNEQEILPKRKRLSLRKKNSLNNNSKNFSPETNDVKSETESSNNMDVVVKLESENKLNETKKEIRLSDSQNPENPQISNGEKYSKEDITVIELSSPIPSSSEDDLHLPKKRKVSSENPREDAKNSVKNSVKSSGEQSSVDPVEKKENPTNEKMKDLNKMDKDVDEDMTSVTDDRDVDENKEEIVFRVPYYLENFKMILSQVLLDEEYVSLVNNEDRDTIKKFHSLSESSQKLYVRLFARKLTWRMQCKLKYPHISEDLSIYLKELIDYGFGMSENDLTDLSDVLALLPAAELKIVAKSFHYNCTNLTKSQIVELLMNHCKKPSASSMLFGLNSQKHAEMALIKRSKKLLGPCFKLVESKRIVFLRFLALFSLANTTLDEDTAESVSGRFFQMLQVNIGNVVFPQFTICKKNKIFRQRDDFIKYIEVILLESELFSKMEKKDWSAAFDIYVRAKKIYDENTADSDLIEWDRKLPVFLRHCTSGYVFARILFQGVELLQRQRNYKQACHVLQDLLSQDIYACQHRGRWYERLTLNLDQHLKSPAKALDEIEKALKDSWVSPSYRLSLFLRAEKIGKAPNSKLHKRFTKMEQILVHKPPEVIITGKTLPHSLPGIKYQFLTEESEGDVMLCNVEQLVLKHYKKNGYPKGIHAEGSIVSTLFLIFFWEIVFMDIPDVFRCPFQTCPLDMMSSEFYTNRKKVLDDRLQFISSASIQELWDIMAHIWDNYFGVTCSILWNNWTSLGEIQGLVSCIGGEVLAGILGRYAKNPRHTRSGFPDLTLWNVETKKFKICEVKGPGDRLSTKQILWISHLLQLGVDAEVCHIKPIGAKKLISE